MIEFLEALIGVNIPVPFVVFLIVVSQIIFSLFFLPCSQFTILLVILVEFPFSLFFVWGVSLLAFCSTYLAGKRLIRIQFINARIKKEFLSKPIEDWVERGLSTWYGSFLIFGNPILPGSSMGYLAAISNEPPQTLFLRASVTSFVQVAVIVMVAENTIWMISKESYFFAFIFIAVVFALLLIIKNLARSEIKKL